MPRYTDTTMPCIMCRKPATKYAACRPCLKKAARGAARFVLKHETLRRRVSGGQAAHSYEPVREAVQEAAGDAVQGDGW